MTRRANGRIDRDTRQVAADVELLSAHVTNLRVQTTDFLTDAKMLDAIVERIERRVMELWAYLHQEETK